MLVISENYKMRPKHNWYSKLIRKYYKIRVNLTKPRSPIPDADILKKIQEEKRLVIQVPSGGLGDHLVYSSLPELLQTQKGIETFISNKSIYHNKAIRSFVWELNPYIKFTDINGWFIYQPLEREFPTFDGYLQKLFNLQGSGCPKVYYNPHLIEQIKGKNIIDPSFGPSGKANGYYEKDFHKRFIEYLKSSVGDFVLITHRYSKTKNPLEKLITKTFNPDCYGIFTIEELADVIFSARKRYLLYTGAASLSAALGISSTILCNRKTTPNFQYKVNEYIDLMKDMQ